MRPHAHSMYGSLCTASRISHISSQQRRETVPVVRRSSFCQESIIWIIYTNTLKHKHRVTQSCCDTLSRLTEFGWGKTKKKAIQFICWLAGYCISGLRDRRQNISGLTVESGQDQAANFSLYHIKSDFFFCLILIGVVWSSLQQHLHLVFPQRTVERLFIQIIHQAKTMDNPLEHGNWENGNQLSRKKLVEPFSSFLCWFEMVEKTESTSILHVVVGFRTPFQRDLVCHLNECAIVVFAAGPYQQFTAAVRSLAVCLVWYFKLWQTLCDSCVCSVTLIQYREMRGSQT